MAYQSLILGVLFSVGIFAVKSGVGLAYLIGGAKSARERVGGFMLFAVTYLLLFAATAFALTRFDPLRHLAAVQAFVQSGMVVHLVMAGLLVIWGVVLLKRDNGSGSKSRGWLLLAVPCPVCATVIFLSTGFLVACFPDRPNGVVLALYLAFVAISAATAALVGLYRKHADSPAESFLGGAMVMLAVYFLLSVTVMPHFADIEKIYRMARYKSQGGAEAARHVIPFLILITLSFVGGLGFTSKKIRNTK